MKKCNSIETQFFFAQEFFDEIHLTIDDLNIKSTIKFLHIFSKVHDPRMNGKIVYKLEDLLLIVFMAKLARFGDNCMQIADYAKANKAQFEQIGAIHNGEIPSHDTFRRLFMILEPESLSKVFLERMESMMKKIADTHQENAPKYSLLNVDGKEFRGSGRADNCQSPKHNLATLNVFDYGTQICLYAIPIEEKESEITVAREILEQMTLKNVIVTGDALHNQSKTAELITQKKGYYTFIVKDNHQELKEEIINKFGKEKPSKIKVVNTEERQFEFLKLSKSYSGCDWAGQKTYAKVTNLKSNEIFYFISSLSDCEAIQEAIENRWSIEIDLHRSKDELLNEDYVRFTNKNAIATMAVINNIILGFYRVAQTILQLDSLAEARVYFGANPAYYMAAILSMINGNKLTKLIESKLKK